MEENRKHEIRAENRKSFYASGAEDVISFSENEVRISLCGGMKMVVTGEGLKMIGFDKRSGEVRLIGTVKGIAYRDAAFTGKRKIFR